MKYTKQYFIYFVSEKFKILLKINSLNHILIYIKISFKLFS